jgi:nucleoside-diphosphate-sugar epimerase
VSEPGKSERFFVAGATGYVGHALVGVARGHSIATTAHVRPDSRQLGEWRTRFAALDADLDTTPWALDAMTATLAALRPTAVFGLLGTTRKRGAGTGDTYESVDYGLTAMLIDALAAAQLNPVFVYLSSMGVRDGQTGGYLGARAKLEAKLRASPLPYVIARPSFITGPDREESRPLERGAAAVTDLVLGFASRLGAPRLRQRYGSTTATALAGSLVRLARDPGAARRVFESEALR